GHDKATELLRLHTEQPVSADGLAIAGLLTGPKAASPEEMRQRWQEIKRGISQAKQGRLLREQEDLKAADLELKQMAERKK
ncbi:hypothetical protein, partial [Escherichia coli]